MPADGATESDGARTGPAVGVTRLNGAGLAGEVEGDIDGAPICLADDGADDGAELGLVVGTPDGVADDDADDGAELGLVVGAPDGVAVDGANNGAELGIDVGVPVMPANGATDGDGACDGPAVGCLNVGGLTGEAEGDIGDSDADADDGAELGLVVGAPDDVADDGVADDCAELGINVGIPVMPADGATDGDGAGNG